jgi:uncharacterized protein
MHSSNAGVPLALNLHTLLFKTVNYCNLDCDYCYVRRFNAGRRAAVISHEIVARAIGDYVELAKEGRGTGPNGEWMVFLWHGGEPTLAGIDFFNRVLQLERRTGHSDFMINSITSNGTLINEDWSVFLKRNQFRVSISIDGPRPVHDLHRASKSNGSSFDSVINGINMLKRNAHPFGVMCVISEESVDNADEIFNFFADNELKRLTFLPRISKDSWLSPEAYARFMTRILDLWLERDDPDIHVRELENIAHELLGGRAELCEFNGCCGSYLAIDCNGDVYLCDLFIGNDFLKVGNILEESLKSMLDSNRTLEKLSLKSEIHDECKHCRYLSICKGGCLYRRCLTRGRPSDKDFYCQSRKALFEHMSMRLSDVFSCLPKQDIAGPVL